MQKENILEDLEKGLLKYESAGEFLANIRKKFGGDNKKTIKNSGVKKIGAERKDNGRIYTRV